MATEHYVTAMTIVPPNNSVMLACRCGEVFVTSMRSANSVFAKHTKEAQEAEPEPQPLPSWDAMRDMFMKIGADPSKPIFPFDKGSGK
jgi:hypothetical protein